MALAVGVSCTGVAADGHRKASDGVGDSGGTSAGFRQVSNDLIAQVDRICALSKRPCPSIAIADSDAVPLARTANGVALSAAVLDSVRSPLERVGLASLLITWFDESASRTRPAKSDLGSQLLALGVAGVGERIDPLKRTADAVRMRNFQYRGGPVAPRGTPLASQTLALTIAAGGCSGPLVAMLNRLSQVGPNPTPEHRRFSAFAGGVVRDLGAAAYPSDFSCTQTASQ
ncbi:MAG: hypothetical protein J0I47_06590 [Sphingomonas sp.]|uniref:hypothetical protein n=1 Tax=Sphingomonas sp. TaxID=28214 RepID=UPI001AC69FAF|nr:hypothetical protein [Sphingomonas sp.]MBN8807888.1 hypothetical protein [Sphingomonas sp.]